MTQHNLIKVPGNFHLADAVSIYLNGLVEKSFHVDNKQTPESVLLNFLLPSKLEKEQ